MSNYEEVVDDLFWDVPKKKKVEVPKLSPWQTTFGPPKEPEPEPEPGMEEREYNLIQEGRADAPYPDFEDLHDIISDVKKARRKRKNGRY